MTKLLEWVLFVWMLIFAAQFVYYLFVWNLLSASIVLIFFFIYGFFLIKEQRAAKK